MKLYYTIAVLLHLLLAFLSRNKNKLAYMLYLMRGVFEGRNKADLVSVLDPDELKPGAGQDAYTLHPER